MGNEQSHIYAEGTRGISEQMESLQALKEPDSSPAKEPQIQIVVIVFDGKYYGINILSVLEIVKVPKLTWLPCSPHYIAGVISVRGNIQAVVNLKAFLKLGTGHIQEHSRIVLVESGELAAGLLIDEMLDILEISESAILPPTKQGTHPENSYSDGTVRWNDQTVSILQIDAILQALVIDQQ